MHSKYKTEFPRNTQSKIESVSLINQKEKHFTDLNKESFLAAAESLFSDFKNKNEIIDQIKDLQLSRNTVVFAITITI